MAKAGQQPKRGPEMKAAWDLIEAGDVLSARRKAEAVLQSPPTPQDAEDARELLERARMPRQAFLFAGVAALVIALLIAIAILRARV